MNTENSKKDQFPEVVVVEASAGSGKTYALAKRYLGLLINSYLEPDEIILKNILAITFTNKATLEMKERILELLKKIALDAFSDKNEEKEILSLFGVDKKLAKEKARAIIDELIRHYNFFQIQTIDSFINGLLLGCALNIDRSASFKIKRDYQEYLSYCLDLVIEQAQDNPRDFEFFREFLEHYLFVENRSGWFPRKDILLLMQSLFRLSNKYGKDITVGKGKSIEIIKKKKYIYGQIKEMSRQFPENLNGAVKKYILSFIQKNDPVFDISRLPASLKKPVPAMNKQDIPPVNFAKTWKKVHSGLKKLVELESAIIYNPYIKFFQRLLVSLQEVSRKEDLLFLEELNRKARLLFGSDGITVAEVYYRLATRFYHYLIDEFQDTSVLQWRNLEIMVEEALASGGSLFYVGDKKQAIYRFRGGEVGLFDQVKMSFSRFNLKTSRLSKNWRSQKAIVEFNNQVFSQENLKSFLELSGIGKELAKDEEPFKDILAIFSDAFQESRDENPDGYVEIKYIEEKSQSQRDEIIRPKILNLIRDLRERFKFEEIAILARDNSEVELITSWCLEQGFSVESEKTLNILENSLVKEIISFLEFLYSPPNDLSFASFILGDIFGCLSGLSKRAVTDFIFNLSKEQKLKTGLPLYRLFRQNFPGVWNEYFDEFFKNVGFVSVYELVTSIYQSFKVFANFPQGQAFFMKFLELVKEKEDEYVGLGDFLTYLNQAQAEDLYVNVIHSDSLKILTIHKSKGLEFPVVIIPFLGMDIKPPTGGKQTSSYVKDESGSNFSLLRITKAHRSLSASLQNTYLKAYKKACIDELNNIYVALTRPKYELYLFIPQKSGTEKNKARFIIPQELTTCGRKKKYDLKPQAKVSLFLDISPSTYKDWIGALREEFGYFETIKNRAKIRQGDIMHSLLSKIGNCLGIDLDKKLNQALVFTSLKYRFENLSTYKDKIKRLVNQPSLEFIFSIPQAEVSCEKEVVNRLGQAKRIDRLVVKDKEVLVIDYKSSDQAQDAQGAQVAQYMEIAGDIYPTKKIRGFLVYLDKMKAQEVWKK